MYDRRREARPLAAQRLVLRRRSFSVFGDLFLSGTGVGLYGKDKARQVFAAKHRTSYAQHPWVSLCATESNRLQWHDAIRGWIRVRRKPKASLGGWSIIEQWRFLILEPLTTITVTSLFEEQKDGAFFLPMVTRTHEGPDPTGGLFPLRRVYRWIHRWVPAFRSGVCTLLPPCRQKSYQTTRRLARRLKLSLTVAYVHVIGRPTLELSLSYLSFSTQFHARGKAAVAKYFPSETKRAKRWPDPGSFPHLYSSNPMGAKITQG